MERFPAPAAGLEHLIPTTELDPNLVAAPVDLAADANCESAVFGCPRDNQGTSLNGSDVYPRCATATGRHNRYPYTSDECQRIPSDSPLSIFGSRRAPRSCGCTGRRGRRCGKTSTGSLAAPAVTGDEVSLSVRLVASTR